MTKKKLDETQNNQSEDKARATKTVKRLLPTVRSKFIIYFCIKSNSVLHQGGTGTVH